MAASKKDPIDIPIVAAYTTYMEPAGIGDILDQVEQGTGLWKPFEHKQER